MSLQAEMDRESDRRAADREKPEAFEPSPDPEVAASEQAAADGEGADAVADIPVTPEEMAEVEHPPVVVDTPAMVEDAVDLDKTQEQRAAKINLTEVADISDTPHPVAKIEDNKLDDRRNCGIPERLWPVKEIVAYENLHSISGMDRDTLEYTAHERNMYDRYQKLVDRAAAKDHFVVALRMFNAKLPERPAQRLNLNDMKVS